MADFEKELSKLRVEFSQSRADSAEFQFGCLTDRLAAIEAENKSLKGVIIDLKSRSMRDNLFIFQHTGERE